MAYSKTIQEFLQQNAIRREELEKLRSLILEFPFEESIKWGMPNYGFATKNIVGIGSFKNWSCLWFHQGSFLADKQKKLVNAQEGKTSGMRQWRFTNIAEIEGDLVRAYLSEALENHRAGKEIKITKTPKKIVDVPELLVSLIDSNPQFQDQFEKYTAKQRNDFSNYIIDAKREATKLKRLEKIEELWKEGKTLASIWGG